MKLIVVAGSSTPSEIEVEEEKVLVGRAADCNLSLRDPAVESVHASIVATPFPRITNVSGRPGTLFINGVSQETARLNHNDSVVLGDVEIRVDLEKEKPWYVKAYERGKTPFLMILALVLVGALVFGVLTYRQQDRLANTSVELGKFERFGFFSILNLQAAWAPPAVAKPTFETISSVLPNFLLPAKRQAFASSGELNTISVFPPDPLSPAHEFANRNWKLLPPRVGSGRFLAEEGHVLGNYFTCQLHYRSAIFSNATPPEAVGTNPFNLGRLGEVTPLEVVYNYEIWEGLPETAPIDFYSVRLDAPRMPGDVPLIPKMLSPALVSETIEVTNSAERDEQRAAVTLGGRTRVLFRQVKRGGTLVMLTARCHEWQRPRVEEFMEQWIEAQQISEHTYPEADRQRMVEDALAWVAEAQETLPEIEKLGDVTEWKRITDQARILRAFNLYLNALINLQRAGYWKNNPAVPGKDGEVMANYYNEIFQKAKRIHEYVQNPRSHFSLTYTLIERDLDKLMTDYRNARTRPERDKLKQRIDALEEEVDKLLEFTQRAQDPARFSRLDEWFIYAHWKRRQLNEMRMK